MNPLIRRGIRERLRAKNLVAAGIFSLILTATFYLAAFFDGMQVVLPAESYPSSEPELFFNPVNGAREAFTPFWSCRDFF